MFGGAVTEDELNTVVSARGQYYYRWMSWQTLALNVEFARGWDLDTSKQFILGGESGLRGYSARQFTGDKSFLVNAEARLYSPVEILTVALGAVAFVDMGNVWSRQSEIRFEELNYSAGFGMRFGFTRFPNEPIGRIDFGWPLQVGGFAIKVGAEHQF